MFFYLTIYITIATACINVLNYFASKEDLSSVQNILLFSLKVLPLQVIATIFYSLYYNKATNGDVKYISLVIMAMSFGIIFAASTQLIFLGQKLDGYQVAGVLCFIIGMIIMSIPKIIN